MRWTLWVALLAGCTTLSHGMAFFEIEELETGRDIYDAHAEALGRDDLHLWTATLHIDGGVGATTSTAIYGEASQVSHASSLDGHQFTDQSGLHDGNLAIPAGGPIAAPAGLDVPIAELAALLDGPGTITFQSQCAGAAQYVSDNGLHREDALCSPGDWSALLLDANNQQTLVILRAR